MEIVHIVLGKVKTSKMNGVNKVVDQLAENQVELGYNVTVWGITRNPVHDYSPRKYATVLFKDRSNYLPPKGVINELKKRVPETTFHFHGGFILQFFFVAALLRLYGFSYVFTSHGSYNTVAMQRNYWKKRVFIRLFDKFIVHNSKSMHFIGGSEIEGAQKVFSFSNFALIPNGQNMNIKPVHKEIKDSKTLVFGFCGRLDIQTKGLDLLFEGFSNFKKAHPSRNAELWMIGDGPEKTSLMELSKKLGIDKDVIFWGSAFGERKLNLFRKLDFMILTSRNEGLPGVVLEAAAEGVPSIVSKETNMGPYIEHYQAGRSLTQNNPNHIHEALKWASDLKLNRSLSDFKLAAIQMVQQEFNWKLIAAKVSEMYV